MDMWLSRSTEWKSRQRQKTKQHSCGGELSWMYVVWYGNKKWTHLHHPSSSRVYKNSIFSGRRISVISDKQYNNNWTGLWSIPKYRILQSDKTLLTYTKTTSSQPTILFYYSSDRSQDQMQMGGTMSATIRIRKFTQVEILFSINLHF